MKQSSITESKLIIPRDPEPGICLKFGCCTSSASFFCFCFCKFASATAPASCRQWLGKLPGSVTTYIPKVLIQERHEPNKKKPTNGVAHVQATLASHETSPLTDINVRLGVHSRKVTHTAGSRTKEPRRRSLGKCDRHMASPTYTHPVPCAQSYVYCTPR